MLPRAKVITLSSLIMLALVMLSPVALALPDKCDHDNDGDIDNRDISIALERQSLHDPIAQSLIRNMCAPRCSRPNCSINTAPVAHNDTYTVAENATQIVVAVGVLTNDTDADNDALTAALVTPPTSGNLTFNTDGSFNYTPDNGFNSNIIFTYRASDNPTNSNIATVTIEVIPDPIRAIAPPLDPTIPTSLSDATSFLYTGANPIQTGVTTDTINPIRAAVLRGRVLARDNTPLSGVKITLLNHPELGQTLSRLDGMFDMVVNGGGMLVVNYEKTGYLPVQRQITTPWQDYTHLPNVVMIQLDAQVTPIDLNSAKPIQVARGSTVNDNDGTRRATLLFSQGTAASVGDKELSGLNANLNIRATEYTIGKNGPQAMPAALPPSSGYTYAVELSADEAQGQEITFSKPVITYVENFLNFPVGGIVPAGYYDRVKATWIPSNNGRVIKILNISHGMANLDTDGDDAIDKTDKLDALGITDAERQQLATLYAPHQSLWRIPVTHFSPWDFNWPWGPPPDAIPPQIPTPQPDPNINKPDCKPGSVIECQNQVLRESIGITGTPFSLNYGSNRVSGRESDRILTIPLVGSTLPASLIRIELEISVAGRLFQKSLTKAEVASNPDYTFTWDGKDAYGRTLHGGQLATVQIGYVYNAYYRKPSENPGSAIYDRAFGHYSYYGTAVTASAAREEITLLKTWTGSLVSWNTRAQGMGGWSLSVQHAYDPVSRTLLLGNGQKHRANAVTAPTVISTVAGHYLRGDSVDGVAATEARLYYPEGLAIGPDGSLFIADTAHQRIRRVAPNGVITTLAGNGQYGYSGDGGLATAAKLYDPKGIAVNKDGILFIADYDNHRIRRVGLDGIITTIAGNGNSRSSGDGGPATAAELHFPSDIAVGPDGSLFIAETSGNRIRRIGPDGIITTVAGNGGFGGPNGDGGLARTALVAGPTGVSVTSDGTLFIAETGGNRIRRIGLDGIITTVAGNGNPGSSGDGGTAITPALPPNPNPPGILNGPSSVAVGPDGSLFITELHGSKVRQVGFEGIITTVTGNGTRVNSESESGDGGPAGAAKVDSPKRVAMGPDGNLYIVEGHRIRRITSALPGISATDIVIASEDSGELYVFSGNGRHLRTLDKLTGGLRYQFNYNSAGHLTSITDRDGDITRIERDPAGKAVAIVAPYGQRTILMSDANDYLSVITNPAGESYRMGYTPDGLLTSFTDPNRNESIIAYDALGRLEKNQNAASGFWKLSRSVQQNGYTVNMTSAENRTTIYQIENLSTGDQLRLNTAPYGLQTKTLIQTNGTRKVTAPDGTITTTVNSPDPRFNMQAPFLKNLIIKLPSGLSLEATAERVVSLANPNDPLSLNSETNTKTLNGKTFTAVYDAVLRQHTFRSPLNRIGLVKTDMQSRVIQKQVADIEAMNYGYDTRGRLISLTQGHGATARTTTLNYNSEGYLESVTDPLGRTLSYKYDVAGRIKDQILPDGRTMKYSYDANGNVISLIPPESSSHTFTYTPVNLESQYTPPAARQPTPQTQYSYNLDKQLTLITRPDGQLVELDYDTGGRLRMLTIPMGEVRYTYEATSGNISTIENRGTLLSYTYDGALPQSETLSGAIAGKVSRSYNNDFKLSSLSVNNTNIAYTYDGDGLLQQVGDLVLTRKLTNGMLTGGTLGVTATSQSYNTFGELTQLSASQTSNALLDIHYIRDKAGRITQKSETIAGQNVTWTYTYDKAGRLTNVVKNGVTTTYEYDANGNRLFHDDVKGTYDTQDRLLSYGNYTYSYTANGELMSTTNGTQITAYTYDVLGNLTSVILPNASKIEYLIDGRNRRIGKKVNGAKVLGFLYENQLRPAAELDSNNNIVSRFVYATRINVPDYLIKSGVTYRIITDHLGSPRLVVNTATGAVVQRIDYDAFGNITNDTNPGFQPFGFAGGLYDRDTKLVRFGARDYDAETGRWTTKDPIGFRNNATNLYGYVLSDPLNSIDPIGLKGITIGYQGGSLVGLIMGMWVEMGTGVYVGTEGINFFHFLGGGFGVGIQPLSAGVALGYVPDINNFWGHGTEIGADAEIGGFAVCTSNPDIQTWWEGPYSSVSISGPSAGIDLHVIKTYTWNDAGLSWADIGRWLE